MTKKKQPFKKFDKVGFITCILKGYKQSLSGIATDMKMPPEIQQMIQELAQEAKECVDEYIIQNCKL